jgi:formylglycine-generating enzyme required for sulfatase activity
MLSKIKKIYSTITTIAVALLISSCSDHSPMAANSADPVAKLTLSSTEVAGTCEAPNCRPGFGGVDIAFNPAPASQPVPEVSPGVFDGTAILLGGETMEFVRIEPGAFTMGAPLAEVGRRDPEGPQHEVTISRGFYLGKYEVTQGQWESVMGTTPWSGENDVQANVNHPAVHVSWDDAQSFIHQLNEAAGDSLYRLPTEAEWEYAARAGTSTVWSFGDDESLVGNYAWHVRNTWLINLNYAQPVGTKLPNPWGLYDVHGNVREWCQDWLDDNYYSRSPSIDPPGPSTESSSAFLRVLRGGGFSSGATFGLRSASRNGSGNGNRIGTVGFRLLRIK